MTGRDFLDRFDARYGRRPEYFFPVYCYDVGRLMMTALANARPLTGAGVKQALEKIGKTRTGSQDRPQKDIVINAVKIQKG